MKQEGLKYFTDTYLLMIAMFLFLFAYLAISVWAWSGRQKKHFDEMSKLPLERAEGDKP